MLYVAFLCQIKKIVMLENIYYESFVINPQTHCNFFSDGLDPCKNECDSTVRKYKWIVCYVDQSKKQPMASTG